MQYILSWMPSNLQPRATEINGIQSAYKIQDCGGPIKYKDAKQASCIKITNIKASIVFSSLVTFCFLVRFFVFSLLVVRVLCGLLSRLQQLANVVILNCNVGKKKRSRPFTASIKTNSQTRDSGTGTTPTSRRDSRGFFKVLFSGICSCNILPYHVKYLITKRSWFYLFNNTKSPPWPNLFDLGMVVTPSMINPSIFFFLSTYEWDTNCLQL